MGKALDTKPSNFKFDPQNPHGRRQFDFSKFSSNLQIHTHPHTPTPHKHAHNNTPPQKKEEES